MLNHDYYIDIYDLVYYYYLSSKNLTLTFDKFIGLKIWCNSRYFRILLVFNFYRLILIIASNRLGSSSIKRVMGSTSLNQIWCCISAALGRLAGFLFSISRSSTIAKTNYKYLGCWLTTKFWKKISLTIWLSFSLVAMCFILKKDILLKAFIFNLLHIICNYSHTPHIYFIIVRHHFPYFRRHVDRSAAYCI